MLMNCVAYRNGHKLAEIDVERISDHLQTPGCFVWVALCDPSDAELAQMQEEFGLHELAIEDARQGHERPKIEEYGDTVFAVMKLPELAGGRLDVGELNIFVGANFVLSVRSRSGQELGVRERAEREPELLAQGAGFVFYALTDAVVDRYFPLIDNLETELESIEERIFQHGAAKQSMRRLYALKRKVTQLHHAVAPLAEAVGKLCHGRVPAVASGSEHYFRDVYDHLTRIHASLDAIRETIATAIQVNLSMIAIDDAETTKKLAAWAGLFAAATAFAGIWGMNFEHMPELQWRWGYPAALGLIGLTCAELYRRFKRARWL